MREAAVLVLICLLAGCMGNPGKSPEREADGKIELAEADCVQVTGTARQIAIPDLIRNAGRYEGRAVSVTGYFSQYFEHSAVYPTREAEPYSHDSAEGIWIEGVHVPDGTSNRYLTFIGTFSAKNHGHLGQWPGTICVSAALTAPAGGQ